MKTGIAFWLGVFTGAVMSIIAVNEEIENAEREFQKLLGRHSCQSPQAIRRGHRLEKGEEEAPASKESAAENGP